MAYDYGYGNLGNELIELLRYGAPNLDAATDLIRRGADINAIGNDDSENILSEILCGYWQSARSVVCDFCEEDNCEECEEKGNFNPNLGQSMCAIIRFFLDHGFDVNKQEGCFGAQCLFALTLSTFDRYTIEATKILLDAGAVNRTISLVSTSRAETPWDFIGAEGSYQATCMANHSLANIFEAVYQIYQAVENGKPYDGIDSYEMAIGKKINEVMAETDGVNPIFYTLDLPEFKKDNCYNQTLYFVYDGGVLISTQYADFWTDTILPSKGLVDVSECFDGIVGNTIKEFKYDHNSIVKGTTHYGQPVTTIEMDSGCKVRFSINIGQVDATKRAAFYELI